MERLMIIDFHAHLEDDSAYLDGLLQRMDFLGIDRVVIFHPDNQLTEEAVRQHPDRLIGFAYIHPLYRNARDQVHHYLGEAGFRGVKMNPTGNWPKHYYPNDRKAYPTYEAIASYDVPLLYHMGAIFRDPANPARAKVKYCQPLLLDDVARDIPTLKLVVAHGGRPFVDQTISLCICPNVFVDISWSQLPMSFWKRTVVDLWQAFGDERLLYGSDVNLNRPPLIMERYNQARHMLEAELGLGMSAVRKIMGDNAARLLKLPAEQRGSFFMGADDPNVPQLERDQEV
jgi:predicted TIM-barrel fold metal-dependent hydrolase